MNMKTVVCNKCNVKEVDNHVPWTKGWWEVSRYSSDEQLEYLHFCRSCANKVVELLDSVEVPELGPVA